MKTKNHKHRYGVTKNRQHQQQTTLEEEEQQQQDEEQLKTVSFGKKQTQT